MQIIIQDKHIYATYSQLKCSCGWALDVSFFITKIDVVINSVSGDYKTSTAKWKGRICIYSVLAQFLALAGSEICCNSQWWILSALSQIVLRVTLLLLILCMFWEDPGMCFTSVTCSSSTRHLFLWGQTTVTEAYLLEMVTRTLLASGLFVRDLPPPADVVMETLWLFCCNFFKIYFSPIVPHYMFFSIFNFS